MHIPTTTKVSLALILSLMFITHAYAADVTSSVNADDSLHMYNALENTASIDQLINSADGTNSQASLNDQAQPSITVETDTAANTSNSTASPSDQKSGFNIFGWLVKIL